MNDNEKIGSSAIEKNGDPGPSHDELIAAIEEAVPGYGKEPDT